MSPGPRPSDGWKYYSEKQSRPSSPEGGVAGGTSWEDVALGALRPVFMGGDGARPVGGAKGGDLYHRGDGFLLPRGPTCHYFLEGWVLASCGKRGALSFPTVTRRVLD